MNRPYEDVATIDMFFEMPRMMQKRLDHTTQFADRFGTIYFIKPAAVLTRTAQLTASRPDVISSCLALMRAYAKTAA